MITQRLNGGIGSRVLTWGPHDNKRRGSSVNGPAEVYPREGISSRLLTARSFPSRLAVGSLGVRFTVLSGWSPWNQL